MRYTILGALLLILAGPTGALAQNMTKPPSPDCSKLSGQQQSSCRDRANTTSPTPAGNGSGTTQSGTINNGGTAGGDTGGSTLGSGGGNGGASPPGQPALKQ